MNKMEVLAALNANKTTRTGIRLDAKKVYTVKFDGNINWAPANQAVKLLEIMFAEEQTSWTEPELYALINAHTEISEKQEPWAIFKFYRPQLIENKFLVMKG